MMEFIQWKVLGPNDKGVTVKKTYDNLKSAKIHFGKACKFTDEEEEGCAYLWGRTSFANDWVLLQEYEYDCEDDDDDDDDDNDDLRNNKTTFTKRS